MRQGSGSIAVLALAGALALLAPAAASALPIPPTHLPPSLPKFRGQAAQSNPLPASQVSHPPEHPQMAPNPDGNIHNDPWMTGAYQRPGPVGRNQTTRWELSLPSLCGSLAFDSRGRIVSVCPTALLPPQARVIDPATLRTIATYDMPRGPLEIPGTTETKLYQNFSGGGYFFLDRQDRIWAPTKTGHVNVVAIADDGSMSLERDYDLSAAITDARKRIISALPGFDGRIWFASPSGDVGTLDPGSGRVRSIRLGEGIGNSFSVAKEGVYIVSDKRLYRFEARSDGVPRVVWSEAYRNSGILKPSQVSAGSGTTPDIMPGNYVGIADNDDPMNVVVYRRQRTLRPGQDRVVCEVPVFRKGASATENSLITSGNTIVIENNYGYKDPLSLETGALTEPGFERIDVKPDGSGCRKVWSNTTARAPSVVPKLSTATGLIYAYTRDPDPIGSESYYWTAIDFRSGETVWQRYAGSGISYNNNYAGLALGPDGTAYLGTFGGIVALRETP